MSDTYPHVRVRGIGATATCACGAINDSNRSDTWGSYCPAAMRAEIDRLRADLAHIEQDTADARRLGASIIKAQDRARNAERASILRALDTLGEGYRQHHGGGGDYCRALGELREVIVLGCEGEDPEAVRRERDGLRADLAREEHNHGLTIDQRDHAEGWADELANQISGASGHDIGEHSNLNNPWDNAQDALVLLVKERDRLRDILDAETGKRGPEGWTHDFATGVWTHDVARVGRSWYRNANGSWYGYWWERSTPDGIRLEGMSATALDAMEAADKAAEVKDV